MKIKFYQEFTTGEKIYEDDAEAYALDKLGITVTPREKNGEMTMEQIELIENIVDDFFSGNWTIEWEDVD